MKAVDIIVVGAGAAGCIVAARLAKAGHSVCVFEDGPPDRSPWIKVPAGFVKTLTDPAITWRIPQVPGAAIDNRVIPVIQGRTLGGSSSVNGMIVNRGQAADYDGWAQRGNSGWSYAEVLPYFRKTECWTGPGDDRFRGRDGPMRVTVPQWPSPANDAFLAAAEAAGVPRNPDHNGAVQAGAGAYQSAIHRGRRVSTADAFLRPAMRARSLRVETGCRVTRVVITDGIATEVEFRRHGRDEVRTLTARRAVVVCAGAVNTPRLLQLSGLGPGDLLSKLGIAVVRDLRGVGENLRDHYSPRLVARTRRTGDSMNGRERMPRLIGEVLRWLTGRPSILSLSPALLNVFWKSHPALERPDFALVYAPASYRRGYIGQLDRFAGITCGAWVMRPESSGYVRLRSPDWRADPDIDARYLSDDYDRRVTIAALRFARGLLSSDAMRPVIEAETFPGPDVQSDDDWLAFARAEGNSSNHLVGTARMGPDGDPMAVLDPRLRLRGVAGLRVMDSSVMPTMPSANTWAASMMIAEKGAAMLVEDLASATQAGPVR
ncbi:GMC family oxidoreductase [Mesobacterium pallidum]|uniref:GMC family oxidoreductase n=1 Tax=Mesobacterium pallidum TaxID=2872037 RepID=UPI001EE39EAA|nr:FAD-dependent oxidoreductase [Mesobacterium pallidum]